MPISTPIAMTKRLYDLARKYSVVELADIVLEDQRFWKWPASGSPQGHHHYDGGLAVHTMEVVELCMAGAKILHVEDKRHLFLAALYHDIGKVRDYEYNGLAGEWQNTDHRSRVRHVCRSALMWHDARNAVNEDYDQEDVVLHAILAHHGCLEWGSPVTPQTEIAWILHCADHMSARVYDSFQ